MDIEKSIRGYKESHGIGKMDVQAVIFDMDGVLYDSMPAHSEAWVRIMEEHNLPFTIEDVYLHEGRTARSTIGVISERIGREIPEEEGRHLYQLKAELFAKYPTPPVMKGSFELIQKLRASGLYPMVVTGSALKHLDRKLNNDFDGAFQAHHIVTSEDVKHGKPNPEPYLLALQKAKIEAHQAIVIENAPLGAQAAVGAGIFTIVANTGPLPDAMLLEAKPNLLYSSMQAIADNWEELIGKLRAM